MNIRPLFDNVVVEIEQNKATSVSGFILPSSSDKYTIAKVLAVGTGGVVYGKQVTIYVNVGDKILIDKSLVIESKVEGQTINIIRQSDILAVVE